LCADNDENGTGRVAAHAARARFLPEGRRVRVIMPTDRDTDFNDLLMQKAECDGGCDVS
jgi:hypothetical protein